jgi:hypothetical protein
VPTYTLELVGDDSDLAEALGSVVRNTKRAKKEADALEKSLKKMTKAERAAAVEAAKLAKAEGKVSKTTKKMTVDIESAKLAADGLGGSIGGAVGLVENFARAAADVGNKLGPVGGIAAGVGLAIGAVGFASVKASAFILTLLNDTANMAAELDGPLVSGAAAAIAKMDGMAVAFEGARSAGAQLQVLLAAELAPSMTTTTEAFIGAILKIAEAKTAFEEFASTVKTTMVEAGIPTLELVALIEERLGPAMENINARGFGMFISAGKEFLATSDEMSKAVEVTAEEAEKAGDAWRQWTQDMDQAELGIRAAKVRDLASAQREEAQEVAANRREQDKLNAAVLKSGEKVEKMRAKLAKSRAKDAKEEQDLIIFLQDFREGQERDRIAKQKEANRAIAEGAVGLAATLVTLTKEGSAAHKAAFLVTQGAAVASAVVNTLAGAARALAEYPYPASLGIAALVTAQGALNIAGIVAATVGSSSLTGGGGGGGSTFSASRLEGAGGGGLEGAVSLEQQATAGAPEPSHAGSIANDEVFRKTTVGQAVISNSLKEDLGGNNAVRRQSDAGRADSGGGGSTFLVYQHQAFELPLRDSARIPGSTMNNIQRDGRRSGHSTRAVAPRKLLS